MWPLLRSSASVLAMVWASKVAISDLELVKQVARVNVRPIVKSQSNITLFDAVIDACSPVKYASEFGTRDA